MQINNVVQREIEEKLGVTPSVNSPTHKANVVLMPDNWERFDPVLLMTEDNMKKGVFDFHPNRGIETVSYMIGGELEHKDTIGHAGV
jgi:redox-sensitive bicupin YhaK (pirin superfamily)